MSSNSVPPSPALDFCARSKGRFTNPVFVAAGAAGQVWKLRDELLDRFVCAKCLALPSLPRGTTAEAALQQIVQEAQLLAACDHVGVVRVFDVVRQEDLNCVWILTEWVEGLTLEDFASSWPDSSPDSVFQLAQLALARQLVEALLHVSARGIVHRDIKPANVLLCQDGHLKLIDFGVSTTQWLTSGQTFTGTLSYSDPEVMMGEPASLRSDLYAAGLTLLAAAGRLPELCRSSAPGTLLRGFSSFEFAQELAGGVQGMYPDVARVVLRFLRRDPSGQPLEKRLDSLPAEEVLQWAAGELRRGWAELFQSEPTQMLERVLLAEGKSGAEMGFPKPKALLDAVRRHKRESEAEPHVMALWMAYEHRLLPLVAEPTPTENADSVADSAHEPLQQNLSSPKAASFRRVALRSFVGLLLLGGVVWGLSQNTADWSRDGGSAPKKVSSDGGEVSPIVAATPTQPTPLPVATGVPTPEPSPRPQPVVVATPTPSPTITPRPRATPTPVAQPVVVTPRPVPTPRQEPSPTPEKKEVPATTSVQFVSRVWGELSVDGDYYTELPRAEPLLLPSGEHLLRFTNPLFHPWEKKVVIAGEQQQIEIEPRAKTRRISIQLPDMAVLFVDGKRRGGPSSRFSLVLAYGRRRIRLQYTNGEEIVRTVRVGDGTPGDYRF